MGQSGHGLDGAPWWGGGQGLDIRADTGEPDTRLERVGQLEQAGQQGLQRQHDRLDVAKHVRCQVLSSMGRAVERRGWGGGRGKKEEETDALIRQCAFGEDVREPAGKSQVFHARVRRCESARVRGCEGAGEQ
jgi:hypothetical protein